VGPRLGLDPVEKRKVLHCREPNPGRPARSYTDSSVTMMSAIFWDMAPCSLLEFYRRFGETCFRNLRDKRVIQTCASRLAYFSIL
jgi:hypothetical protein